MTANRQCWELAEGQVCWAGFSPSRIIPIKFKGKLTDLHSVPVPDVSLVGEATGIFTFQV